MVQKQKLGIMLIMSPVSCPILSNTASEIFIVAQ